MAALARLIITNHQIATVLSNFESFNIRLLSVIIMMLLKVESKTQQDNSKEHKRVLNFESNDLLFSSDFDSIINFFFARGIRKRLKYINISNQSTFKFKSFISLTVFILSLSFILLDQGVFKSRFFTSFIFINII